VIIDDLKLRSIAKVVINDLAKEFQGNHVFFFHNESDIQCRLFRRLTQKKVDTELVHAEYGMYWDNRTKSKRRGYFDIAVWHPDKKDAAIQLWGKSAREFSRQMADIVSVAIEIDYFYGSATEKRRKFQTITELKKNRDIQKLIEVARSKADSYLMIFWDHDVNDDKDASASCLKIHQTLRRLYQQYAVKSILVSRDHVLKKCGFR
jgi:hypothetical protein